jgi:hypothetical protein
VRIARCQLIAALTLLAYVASTIVWLDFMSVDACIDAGGVIRDARCAFTREEFTPLLGRGWRVVAINLALPAIPVLGAASLVWLFLGRGKPGV